MLKYIPLLLPILILPAVASVAMSPPDNPHGLRPPGFKSDTRIITEFRERAAYELQRTAELVHPQMLDQGGLFEVAANLHLGTDIDWAVHRLRAVNEDPRGDMFWMIPMALVMKAGEPHLRDSEWAFIRRLWREYFPYRGDTENHWVMYYAALYIVCEMFPEAGPEAWYNGKSSRENMEEAREFLFDWIRITTSYGQGEYDSPNYLGEFTRPMVLLAGWAKDPEMRVAGRMMMDYLLLDYAVESVNGAHGGAHSRIYPRNALQPSLGASPAHGWMLFGQGEYQRNATNTMIAMSGYTPPPILYRIAHDRTNPYVHRELKRTRWRIRNAGPEAFEVDNKWTIPVYKYSYVHRDYVLGSSQGGLLQPIQQQTWSLKWHESPMAGKSNTFFAVQPYSDPLEGTMYFAESWDTVTDLIARSKVDYDSPDKLASGSPHEQVYQQASALIGLYDMPEDNRFPLIHAYFSRDLKDVREDESGWIFAQGGPVYLAYFPLAPGEWREVDWTGLLKGGAGAWISRHFRSMSEGSRSFVSEHLKNGYVFQVASSEDFASRAEFEQAVLALPLEYRLEPTPRVSFTNLEGIRMEFEYGQTPRKDGRPIRYEDWKLYDGPFARAARESRTLEITHGGERLFLDFRNLQRIETTEK